MGWASRWRLGDRRLLARDDLRESLEQMRRGEGRVLVPGGGGNGSGSASGTTRHATTERESPPSLQDVLDHAEEIAREFERNPPREEDYVSSEPKHALREALLRRGQAERDIADAVRRLRDSRFSWTSVGTMLGASGATARARYEPLITEQQPHHRPGGEVE